MSLILKWIYSYLTAWRQCQGVHRRKRWGAGGFTGVYCVRRRYHLGVHRSYSGGTWR